MTLSRTFIRFLHADAAWYGNQASLAKWKAVISAERAAIKALHAANASGNRWRKVRTFWEPMAACGSAHATWLRVCWHAAATIKAAV